MFNPLTPTEVVTAIGRTARAAATSEEQGSDFDRDQLMSAYSATRHLAVEIESYGDPLDDFAAGLVELIEACPASVPGIDPARHAARLRRCASGQEVGEAAASLVDDLVAAGEPGATLLADVHRRLRDLADLEVELLADGLA
jgi:hypothetical protein